jgi:chemotaxis protein methyltransferase CheR
MRGPESPLELDEFRLLSELFNQTCGLVLGAESRPVIERRLRERLHVLGLHSFGEYHAFLRSSAGRAELDEAIDLVTINETYFFREDYQIRALQTDVLPKIALEDRSEWLSVWSAGCSTGEEVYSIAIAAHQTQLFASQNIRIFGSDISRRCIATARRAVYGLSAFRSTPAEIRKRYFIQEPGGARVANEIRNLCHFDRVNLLETQSMSMAGRLDVIFCRNVLIYFDAASRRRVIDMFYERLVPGGFLFLGHAESLLNVSTAFELVHLRDDLVYKKPLSASRFGRSAR